MTLGEVAYEAYFNNSAGKSLISGDDLPTWFILDQGIKEAWEVSAKAVIAQYNQYSWLYS